MAHKCAGSKCIGCWPKTPQYQSTTTVKLTVDWTGMVHSSTGSLDLFLILSGMTSNFLYLSFSTLYYSSLWSTVTIVLSPPLSMKCPVSIKCHCLRKCSRGKKLWLTDLAEEVGCDKVFQKPPWLTSLTFSFGVSVGVSFDCGQGVDWNDMPCSSCFCSLVMTQFFPWFLCIDAHILNQLRNKSLNII